MSCVLNSRMESSPLVSLRLSTIARHRWANSFTLHKVRQLASHLRIAPTSKVRQFLATGKANRVIPESKHKANAKQMQPPTIKLSTLVSPVILSMDLLFAHLLTATYALALLDSMQIQPIYDWMDATSTLVVQETLASSFSRNSEPFPKPLPIQV